MTEVIWAAAIGAVALIAQALINRRSSTKLQTTADATRHDVRKIDLAVNNQETGFPTLVQRVIDQDEAGAHTAAALARTAEELAAFRAWQTKASQLMAHQMGVVLPPPPPEVVPLDPS